MERVSKDISRFLHRIPWDTGELGFLLQSGFYEESRNRVKPVILAFIHSIQGYVGFWLKETYRYHGA